MTENVKWWIASLGAFLIAPLVASIALVATGGWIWFSTFLSGQAAAWVQAFGSVAAILAAYKLSRTQIEADRLLESLKQAEEDARKLSIIDAILGNLELSLPRLENGLDKYTIPTRWLGSVEHIETSCAAVKSIDLFQCPSTALIPILAILRIQCDSLQDSISHYDRAFDDYKEVDVSKRGLKNSLSALRSGLTLARTTCRDEIANLLGKTAATKPRK